MPLLTGIPKTQHCCVCVVVVVLPGLCASCLSYLAIAFFHPFRAVVDDKKLAQDERKYEEILEMMSERQRRAFRRQKEKGSSS